MNRTGNECSITAYEADVGGEHRFRHFTAGVRFQANARNSTRSPG